MRPLSLFSLHLSLLFLAGILPSNAATINVLPGVNNVPITQVIYGIPGSSDVVQTSPAMGVAVTPSDTAVNVKSVKVNNNGLLVDLNFVNTQGATVMNVNPELSNISGVGVFNHGVTTNSNGPGGIAGFNTALASTSSDFDLRNFCFYDYLTPGNPTQDVPDYDILYTVPMLISDYLLVSERNGNTYFKVTPLKQDGTPFEFANKLLFGGSGGAPYSVYDWNSGYAAATNEPTQAQAFSVASAAKFFEGTTETPGPIYGFRIDNDGQADVKMVVISNTTFENRLVPEPSTALLSWGAGVLFAFSRNRRHRWK